MVRVAGHPGTQPNRDRRAPDRARIAADSRPDLLGHPSGVLHLASANQDAERFAPPILATGSTDEGVATNTTEGGRAGPGDAQALMTEAKSASVPPRITATSGRADTGMSVGAKLSGFR